MCFIDIAYDEIPERYYKESEVRASVCVYVCTYSLMLREHQCCENEVEVLHNTFLFYIMQYIDATVAAYHHVILFGYMLLWTNDLVSLLRLSLGK